MIDERAKLMKNFIKYENALLRLSDETRNTFTFAINGDKSMRDFLKAFFEQKKDETMVLLKKVMKVK